MTLPLEQVKDAHELWVEANARSNTRKQREQERAAALEVDSSDDEKEVDLSDIDKLFKEKGQGPHLLEMEFVPVTESPVEYTSAKTGLQTRAWIWRHKSVEKVEARRYPTKSEKGFDTGVLAAKLRSIQPKHGKEAYQRACHILKLNMKHSKAAALAAGAGVQPIVNRETQLKQWVRICFLCFWFSNLFY